MNTISFLLVTTFVLLLSGWAFDGQMLQPQTAVAVVVGKDHQDVKKSYTTERIGNVNRTVPRVTPEQFILKLRIDGMEAAAVVDRELYRSAQTGQRMRVKYQKRRLTGVLKVLSIEPNQEP